MKIRDVLFSALLCIFLCGPGALWAAQEKLHLDLPSWFTAEDAQYLSGGISKANVKQNLTVEGFESEQLQEALENKIGNHIPLKAAAILHNKLYNMLPKPIFSLIDIVQPYKNHINDLK